MEIAAYINTFIWVLLIANIIFSFSRRNQLIAPTDTGIEEIHADLIQEVKIQQQDGYRVISVHEKTVKLIKKRRYWFP